MVQKPNFVPVSRDRHGGLFWYPPRDWRFATNSIVAALALAEIPRAALALPIAFRREGQEVVPVALLGFEAGQNLFVDEAGRWLGSYIPATFRGYPFALAAIESSGKLILCVDEGSNAVAEEGPERFFEPDGSLSPKLSRLLEFLRATIASQQAARQAAGRLGAAGLLEPWPLVVRRSEGDAEIAGLWRVAEAKLVELDGDTLKALMTSGTMSLAYCQLLSMQHTSRLEELHQHYRAAARRLAETMKASLKVEEPLAFDWSSLSDPLANTKSF